MPMAPRPSSPTISYLPALLTVSISELRCLLRARLPQVPRIHPGRRPRVRQGSGLCCRTFVFRLTFFGGHASADTWAPLLAQYPAEFLEVNATGVPVFRTRYLTVWAAPEKIGRASCRERV